MILLAIETSSSACSVALSLNDEVYAAHVHAPMQQSLLVLSMIQELLKSKNIELNQLNAIAFGCGPGSFTGVRIATSVTQGLAYALNIPVIPISSLASLAQTVYQDHGWKKVLAAVDARIQEVYWAAYEVNDQGLMTLCGIEQVGKPTEIIAPSNDRWYGAGNAWDVYKHNIHYQPVELEVTCLPAAIGVAKLATMKYKQQSWIEASHAHPVYLRNEVAKKS